MHLQIQRTCDERDILTYALACSASSHGTERVLIAEVGLSLPFCRWRDVNLEEWSEKYKCADMIIWSVQSNFINTTQVCPTEHLNVLRRIGGEITWRFWSVILCIQSNYSVDIRVHVYWSKHQVISPLGLHRTNTVTLTRYLLLLFITWKIFSHILRSASSLKY